MSARRVVPAVLVAIAATCIAVFGFFYFRDNLGTHYPIKVISARIFRAGQIPWWNFYDGGGQPLAGNPNTLTFYPDNILYLFLPPHVARQVAEHHGGASFVQTTAADRVRYAAQQIPDRRRTDR